MDVWEAGLLNDIFIWMLHQKFLEKAAELKIWILQIQIKFHRVLIVGLFFLVLKAFRNDIQFKCKIVSQLSW